MVSDVKQNLHDITDDSSNPDIRYSINSTDWQQFLDDNYQNTGSGQRLKDIREIKNTYENPVITENFTDDATKKTKSRLADITDKELSELLRKNYLGPVYTDLSFTNLRGRNLYEAELVGANLVGADLRDVNLRGAQFDSLDGAICNTVRKIDPSVDNATKKRLFYDPSSDAKSINQAISQKHDSMVDSGKIVELTDKEYKEIGLDKFDVKGIKKDDYRAYKKELTYKFGASLEKHLKQYTDTMYELNINGSTIEVYLSNRAVKEILGRLSKEKVGALNLFDNVVKHSEYTYSSNVVEKNNRNKSKLTGYDVFYTPVKIGDEVLGVKVIAENQQKMFVIELMILKQERQVPPLTRLLLKSTQPWLVHPPANVNIANQSQDVNNNKPISQRTRREEAA